jgi:B12-binding domain/radical SAM domain protein
MGSLRSFRRAVVEDSLEVILFYTKPNRYSFNALAGALETRGLIGRVRPRFPSTGDELVDLLDSVCKKARAVLCFSFFTTQLPQVGSMVRLLRERWGEGLLLLAGGPHPSGDPWGTLRMGFDMVVVGEGERSFVELLERLLDDSYPNGITGVITGMHNGGDKTAIKGPPVDLNRYLPFSLRMKKFGPIEITRGCPYGCKYCQTPQIHGKRPRHRDIDTIVGAARTLVEKGRRDIRFISPNAFSYGSIDGKSPNVTALEELLRSLRVELGGRARIFFGTFPSEVRPEHVTTETIGILKAFADNNNLTIGAQSGSQRMLDLMGRGHTVEDILNAARISIASGMRVNVDLIFGLPGEDEEDVQMTISLMRELKGMGARIHAHTFMPLPQTPWAKARPGGLSSELTKVINEMLPSGTIFGQWMQQQQWAKEMEAYLND